MKTATVHLAAWRFAGENPTLEELDGLIQHLLSIEVSKVVFAFSQFKEAVVRNLLSELEGKYNQVIHWDCLVLRNSSREIADRVRKVFPVGKVSTEEVNAALKTFSK